MWLLEEIKNRQQQKPPNPEDLFLWEIIVYGLCKIKNILKYICPHGSISEILLFIKSL